MSPDPKSGFIDSHLAVSSETTGRRFGAQKLRVVIGAFEQASNLTQTLNALIAQGFAMSDFCLLGTAVSLSIKGSIE